MKELIRTDFESVLFQVLLLYQQGNPPLLERGIQFIPLENCSICNKNQIEYFTNKMSTCGHFICTECAESQEPSQDDPMFIYCKTYAIINCFIISTSSYNFCVYCNGDISYGGDYQMSCEFYVCVGFRNKYDMYPRDCKSCNVPGMRKCKTNHVYFKEFRRVSSGNVYVVKPHLYW